MNKMTDMVYEVALAQAQGLEEKIWTAEEAQEIMEQLSYEWLTGEYENDEEGLWPEFVTLISTKNVASSIDWEAIADKINYTLLWD